MPSKLKSTSVCVTVISDSRQPHLQHTADPACAMCASSPRHSLSACVSGDGRGCAGSACASQRIIGVLEAPASPDRLVLPRPISLSSHGIHPHASRQLPRIRPGVSTEKNGLLPHSNPKLRQESEGRTTTRRGDRRHADGSARALRCGGRRRIRACIARISWPPKQLSDRLPARLACPATAQRARLLTSWWRKRIF